MISRGKRALASFLDTLLFPVTIVLWIFNKKPWGALILGTDVPEGRFKMLIFGLLWTGTIFLVVTWIINVVLWILNSPSLPNFVMNLLFSNKKSK